MGFIQGAESIMAAEMEILAERISQLNPYAARRDTSREPNVYQCILLMKQAKKAFEAAKMSLGSKAILNVHLCLCLL